MFFCAIAAQSLTIMDDPAVMRVQSTLSAFLLPVMIPCMS